MKEYCMTATGSIQRKRYSEHSAQEAGISSSPPFGALSDAVSEQLKGFEDVFKAFRVAFEEVAELDVPSEAACSLIRSSSDT